MNQTLQWAYHECAVLTRREAKNFYYAFIMLPPTKRRAIYAIYSYCRIVDDAADLAPSVEIARAELSKLRQALANCLAGRPEGPIFTALADVKQEYHLKQELLEAVIDGVEQDLTIHRYADFQQLRDYCWKVASAVGLLTLEVFEYTDPTAIKHAEDLGLAMQLTNILRDIREDLEIGRIYLPQDELARFGVSEADLSDGQVTDAFRSFMRFQVERARSYFSSGAKLASLVTWSARPCPLVLQAVYSQILDEIERQDYNIFTHRIRVSDWKKVTILLRTWFRWLLV